MHFREWKFMSSDSNFTELTIFHHWFRLWLGADQATSQYLNQWWLNYRRIYASLGLNELNNPFPIFRTSFCCPNGNYCGEMTFCWLILSYRDGQTDIAARKSMPFVEADKIIYHLQKNCILSCYEDDINILMHCLVSVHREMKSFQKITLTLTTFLVLSNHLAEEVTVYPEYRAVTMGTWQLTLQALASVFTTR